MTAKDHIRNPAEWGVDQVRTANEAVGEGERVRVVGIDGLTLRVTREAAG